MEMELRTEGRRTYILGNTYLVKDQLRAAGCRWDADKKAWWMGKRESAQDLIAKLGADTRTAATPVANGNGGNKVPRDGIQSVVAGRGEYKGKTYYIAGRTVRGDTHWDDGVAPVRTQDRTKVLLYFRDGSIQFWAAVDQVRITKTYSKPQTIQGLRDFAAEQKQAKDDGENDCWMCRREGERGNLRMHLHDGCEVCGAEG